VDDIVIILLVEGLMAAPPKGGLTTMLLSNLHETVPAGLTVALYKGTRPGMSGVMNRVGRYLDDGNYSHSELIIRGLSYSSSFEDKGVRAKVINYSSVGCWDFIPIADPAGELAAGALTWFYTHMGQPYDLLGNLHFVFGFVRNSDGRWFCSESTAAALGFHEPHRYGPSGLAAAIGDRFGSPIIRIPKLREYDTQTTS
jgi:hypothetical protein